MRRWLTVMLLTCAAALMLIVTFHSRVNDLDALARAGAIESDAPIKASAEIVIQAPAEKVWGILTAVNDWPKWQSDVKEAEMIGPLESGTAFTWRSGGTRIHSKIALVTPSKEIAWTGTALNATAIHVWKLDQLPGNKTLVKTEESMSGFMLTLFYSSKELQTVDQSWLERLKLEAERQGAIPR
jgi:uncharacterized membrane protein